MAEYNGKKYYWFRMREDFFDRHDIKIIKSMPNGAEYVIFYLQLLCESISHNGRLRFNENIPYNPEMLSVVTGTNIDTVKGAMQVLEQLKLIEVLPDETIYMRAIERLIGESTEGADKKRLQRQNLKNARIEFLGENAEIVSNWGDKCLQKGGQKTDKCPPDIDIDIDIEKDIDINNLKNNNISSFMDDCEFEEENGYNDLTAKLKKELQKHISGISYATYFSGIFLFEILEVKKDIAVISINNSIMERIVEKHKKDIDTALQNVTNGEIVGFTVKFMRE